MKLILVPLFSSPYDFLPVNRRKTTVSVYYLLKNMVHKSHSHIFQESRYTYISWFINHPFLYLFTYWFLSIDLFIFSYYSYLFFRNSGWYNQIMHGCIFWFSGAILVLINLVVLTLFDTHFAYDNNEINYEVKLLSYIEILFPNVVLEISKCNQMPKSIQLSTLSQAFMK